MSTNELSGQETGESVDERRGSEAVAKRVHRALDSFFHVEAADDDGKYTVFSGSGETYTATLPAGECTCPDGQRGSWCKHCYRVAFVTGEIPDIDGVRVESDTSDDTDTSESDDTDTSESDDTDTSESDDTDTSESDDTDTEDDGETLTERVERFERANPDASAIEAISQLGIDPANKEQVEEVLA
jgi:hypothetical protein